MDSYTWIVIIFGILTFGILGLLFFINRLEILQKSILNYYENTCEYLEVRADIMKDMIEFLEEKLEHEKPLKKKLEKAISVIETIRTKKNDFKELKKTEEIITKFIELEKTYPYLKEDFKFKEIKEYALLNEGRIVYSMEGYDKGVLNYNNYQKNRLVNFLSKILKFPKYDYYNK